MKWYWTGPQVARIVRIHYDTLHYWVKCGLVTPCLPASGPRRRSHFSFADVVAVAALKAMREEGISLRQLQRTKNELWERVGLSLDQGLRGGVLVADGRQLFAVLYTFDEAVQIMSLLRGGQMILPLDDLMEQLQQRVETMFGVRDAIVVTETSVPNER